MRFKPVIEIDKKDFTKYRILNGLSKNREYHIKKMDKDKAGLLISIGRKTNPLKPDHPIIWHTSGSRHDSNRFLKLPPNIELIEKHGIDKIFFYPKRL